MKGGSVRKQVARRLRALAERLDSQQTIQFYDGRGNLSTSNTSTTGVRFYRVKGGR